jgi:PAS domain S-box-containing protein
MKQLILVASGPVDVLADALGKSLPEAEIIIATGGSQLLELAAARDPDAILIGHSDNDVLEACRTLRNPRHVPVVMVTRANMSAEERARALECGVGTFVAHDADPRELAALMRARAAARQEDAGGEPLAAGSESYPQLFDAVGDAVFLVDNATGRILQANPAAAAQYGYSIPELLGMKNTDLSAEPGKTARATQSSPAGAFHEPLRVHGRKDGTQFPVEISGRFFSLGSRPVHVAVIRDITERMAHEHEREAVIRILRLANSANGLHQLIRELTGVLQEWSGCHAVGVRLREGDDYPYFETRGFPPEFVEAERYLCARDQAGEPARDSEGDPVLECMCGKVLCSRFDPGPAFLYRERQFLDEQHQQAAGNDVGGRPASAHAQPLQRRGV